MLQQENARVEWKENVADERGVAKTLCAFANDIQQVGGGRVICGLREEKNQYGSPVAVPIGLDENRVKTLKNKVLGICHRNMEPPITPAVSSFPVEGEPSRQLLVFEVTASPYAHRYRIKQEGTHYYIRLDDRTQPANGLINRLMEQKKHWPPFLDQTLPKASLDAFDRHALDRFLQVLNLPNPIDYYLQPDRQLRGDVRSLVTLPPGGSGQGVPRNFALLLFGSEPHLFFRGGYAIFSIYQGKDKTAERSQRFEVFGAIPVIIRNLMDKLQLHLGIEIDKTADMFGGKRNRPRFSGRAVQEAIVNAFVHRDYHSHEPVRITVFSDRIEVANPGGLYNGVSLEDLKKGNVHPSWRNPSLAWFMVALGFAQNEGQGIRTIINETLHLAEKEPGFDISGHWFNVTIPAFSPKPAPVTVESPETGKDGLILVSIGGESIEKQVKDSLAGLGLSGGGIAVNFASEGYIEDPAENWELIARDLITEINRVIDAPEYGRFHLFYRGPVVFAPLIGALIAPAKRLSLYAYENGKYNYTYSIDRKFLKKS